MRKLILPAAILGPWLSALFFFSVLGWPSWLALVAGVASWLLLMEVFLRLPVTSR